MDIAILYEFLLRKIYGYKDRTFQHGADADVYRGINNVSGKTDLELEFNKGVSVGLVAGYLDCALSTLMDKCSEKSQIMKMVKKCRSMLDEPTKEKIDHCIEEMGRISLD